MPYVTGRPYRMSARKEWKASALMQAHVRDDEWGRDLVETPTGEMLVGEVEETTPREEPLRFRGPVCVLVGPSTYSSALMLANAVQDYGIATVIGHRTGGRPNTYGEVYAFTLQHSGLRIGTSTARFVRASGDASDNRPVIPDIELPAGATPSDTLTAARTWILAQRE